ncbi:prostatic acid phosphatase-like [Ruditapes philippinarum]|uniref:prostatic acid phosphatase-like n=1 Tax=Ruditapes philippinarum TaxID=129788 RepID=UPI00295C321F|nr:prostatic acid phosphatase-like [Ruditapes philippinarum]
MKVIQLLLYILIVTAQDPSEEFDDDDLNDSQMIESEDTLRLLQVLYRHGDRSPTRAYTKDIYEESDWPQGYGQLSTEGMQQELELGEFLMREYVDTGFLSSEYSQSEVYVRSTSYERALMSAYSVLSGLFPPGQNDSVWNHNLNWKPIPVHTVPLEEDYLLRMNLSCPVYNTARNNDPQRKLFMQQIMDEFSEFYSYVSKYTGESNTWDGIHAVIDPIFCQYASHYNLPEWITDDILDQFLQLYDLYSIEHSYPREYAYLKGGFLVGEMLEHMINKSKHEISTPQKLFMYSAHDTTIVMFLTTLGIFNDRKPKYTACVLVELHEVQPGQFAVQISYRNESDSMPYVLKLPNCDELCPLEKFAQIMQPSIPKDLKKACGIKGSAGVDVYATSTIIVIVELCLLVLLVIAVAILCWVKRDKLANTHDYMPVPLEMS